MKIEKEVSNSLCTQLLQLQTILEHITLLHKIIMTRCKYSANEASTEIALKSMYDCCVENLIDERTTREELYKTAKMRYIKVFPRSIYQLVIKKATKI